MKLMRNRQFIVSLVMVIIMVAGFIRAIEPEVKESEAKIVTATIQAEEINTTN